jgi:hypothetical protein
LSGAETDRSHARRAEVWRLPGGAVMGDIVYVGITVVFFWLTWQLVKLCERL